MSASSNFYILGLDVSTSCVGWALLPLDEDSPLQLQYGKIIPPENTEKNPVSWYERMDFILGNLAIVFGDAQICAICLEELNSFRGGEVSRQLAGANMGVRYFFWKKYRIEAIPMNTMTMKKHITGTGKAEKSDMVRAVNAKFNLNLIYPDSEKDRKNKHINWEDTADALAAADLCRHLYGDDLREALAQPAESTEGVLLGE